MQQVGCNIQAITCFNQMFFPIDGKFEFSTVAKGGLGMKVCMLTGAGSLFKFDFYHHDLIVPSEDLS